MISYRLYDTLAGIKGLIISWIVLLIAFGFGDIIRGNYYMLMAEALALLLGFIGHELAHREVARRNGCFADYVVWPTGLALALLLAIATGGRFVFAAPGAVMYHCWNRRKEVDAAIAAAGPMANIAIGFASLILIHLFPNLILYVIGYINWFLAFFNLLPLDPLDGAKIMRGNFMLWVIMFLISAYFTFMVF